MTLGHWPWPMGCRNGYSRKVAFLLRKSVVNIVAYFGTRQIPSSMLLNSNFAAKPIHIVTTRELAGLIYTSYINTRDKQWLHDYYYNIKPRCQSRPGFLYMPYLVDIREQMPSTILLKCTNPSIIVPVHDQGPSMITSRNPLLDYNGLLVQGTSDFQQWAKSWRLTVPV